MSHASGNAAHQAEALRQQQMLQVLWRQRPADALALQLRGTPQRQARGWAAYSSNAAASADRMLAGVYPVLACCIGDPAMAVLARQAWRQAPPQRGDLDAWDALGETVPRLLADAPPLAHQPWLPDLARLEWAVYQAERAADAPDGPPAGLDRLAAPDAPALHLQLRPGAALLDLRWPVAMLWQQAQAGVQPAGLIGDTPVPEAALVMRRGWRATVQRLRAGDAAFTAAVLAGRPLGAALDAAAGIDAGWSFEAWLLLALREAWLTAVRA